MALVSAPQGATITLTVHGRVLCVHRTMPRREGGLESHMPAAAAAPDRIGHVLGGGRYGKQPKLSFKEARREARHVESLREVLELTASER